MLAAAKRGCSWHKRRTYLTSPFQQCVAPRVSLWLNFNTPSARNVQPSRHNTDFLQSVQDGTFTFNRPFWGQLHSAQAMKYAASSLPTSGPTHPWYCTWSQEPHDGIFSLCFPHSASAISYRRISFLSMHDHPLSTNQSFLLTCTVQCTRLWGAGDSTKILCSHASHLPPAHIPSRSSTSGYPYLRKFTASMMIRPSNRRAPDDLPLSQRSFPVRKAPRPSQMVAPSWWFRFDLACHHRSVRRASCRDT